jgi:3-isopropylmalate dehydrogenase
MTTHKIAVVGGDGIGPEVIAEALKVIDAAGVSIERIDYDLGAARYLRDGTVLPDSVLDEWRGVDAILLGAVGDPAPGVAAPAGLVERGILLRMRFDLDMYINLRPFRLPPRINCEVIRENTEGTYAGEGGFLRKDTPHEIATQGSVNTRFGVERCVRYAFERASRTERRQHLTWSTRRTCSPSPATCGSAPSMRSPPSTRRSAPATTTSTRRASTSSSGPNATTWS